MSCSCNYNNISRTNGLDEAEAQAQEAAYQAHLEQTRQCALVDRAYAENEITRLKAILNGV